MERGFDLNMAQDAIAFHAPLNSYSVKSNYLQNSSFFSSIFEVTFCHSPALLGMITIDIVLYKR
jgi:hypothetical protein